MWGRRFSGSRAAGVSVTINTTRMNPLFSYTSGYLKREVVETRGKKTRKLGNKAVF